MVSETSGTISNAPTFELQGFPKKKREKKRYENIFEEIRAENFPNMEKEIVNQIQEAQRVPQKMNPRRNMPRHILIKVAKTKHRERILKEARETRHKLNSQSFNKNAAGQKGMAGYI